MYEKTLLASWSDMDFNGHMANTAYLDKSADLRLMFFAENGFPADEFNRRRLGPVVMKDEVEYFKEVRLLEEMRVSLLMGGLSDDGSRFIICNEFWRADGKLIARVTSTGGWLDQEARKLVAAPEALLNAMRLLPQIDGFRDLPSSLK